MQIGFVSGEYPPMEGGVGAYTRELARAMVVKGQDINVFTREQASGSSEPNIKVNGTVSDKWNRQTLDPLRQWIVECQLDLIHIQFQTAAFDMLPAIHLTPANINTIPVVVTFHDLRAPYLFPKAHLVGARDWMIKKIAHDADGVITTDHTDEARLRDEWGIRQLRWIPIGSNIEVALPHDYNRGDWRTKLGVLPSDPLISYFGFLNESKGAIILIDALAELHSRGLLAHLVMIGGRAGASDLTNYAYGVQVDKRIDQHNLAKFVHWTGFVNEVEVSGHFAASDITALPYLDGVSLRRGTLMAALAHGQVIVTSSPSAPIPEIENAILPAPAGDVGAWADVIQHVWNSPVHRREMALEAKEAAKLFTWDTIAENTLQFYKSITRI